ncbi:hypothetical protein GIB67_028584 [Kingdonia uniflora]|uniref:HMA domain-containing protein n=1 Tax=Kingdonia uniflora TaxID=39325 RepID=A0A7J7KZG5_9MAGN|nr:hypothetical protein GIB67_028584 [Kingdonia uniflora]
MLQDKRNPSQSSSPSLSNYRLTKTFAYLKVQTPLVTETHLKVQVFKVQASLSSYRDLALLSNRDPSQFSGSKLGGKLVLDIYENLEFTYAVVDEVPFYATSDEMIIEIQGDGQKVLKALEAVIGHLRKFLVDHNIVALFEKRKVELKVFVHCCDGCKRKVKKLLQGIEDLVPGLDDNAFKLVRDNTILRCEDALLNISVNIATCYPMEIEEATLEIVNEESANGSRH